MRKFVLTVLIIFTIAGVGMAQIRVVTFAPPTLDAVAAIGGTAYCSAYNPGTGNFIGAPLGQQLVEISGVSGATTGVTYNMTGVDTSGLGIFGFSAGTDGHVFGVNNIGEMWQWSDTTSAAVLAATPCQFTRNACVQGTGVNTIVGITGGANAGDITIYSTTDGVNFALIESATGFSKSGCTFDATLTKAWASSDTNNPVRKRIKSGSLWVVDPGWTDTTETNVGPMWYDTDNDILLGSDTSTDTVFAWEASTGGTNIGSRAYTGDAFATVGYNGGYAETYVGGGTFYAGQRGSAGSHVIIVDYTVALPVDDWTLY